MFSTHSYILVLDPGWQATYADHPLEVQFQYPVFVADSAERALTQALEVPPCLVILVGDDLQEGAQALIEQLRKNVRAAVMTIVALTNATSPRWNDHGEIPGLDGFLVKPLSNDILKSLVESAFARNAW